MHFNDLMKIMDIKYPLTNTFYIYTAGRQEGFETIITEGNKIDYLDIEGVKFFLENGNIIYKYKYNLFKYNPRIISFSYSFNRYNITISKEDYIRVTSIKKEDFCML